MRLTLTRKIRSENSIIGELAIDDASFRFYTLELPWRENQHDISCIPTGNYRIKFLPSGKFNGAFIPHLIDVPGRTNVMIHIGNYPRDTEGCILPGTDKSVDFVGNSRMAIDHLYKIMKEEIDKGNTVWIEIKEGE